MVESRDGIHGIALAKEKANKSISVSLPSIRFKKLDLSIPVDGVFGHYRAETHLNEVICSY